MRVFGSTTEVEGFLTGKAEERILAARRWQRIVQCYQDGFTEAQIGARFGVRPGGVREAQRQVVIATAQVQAYEDAARALSEVVTD